MRFVLPILCLALSGCAWWSDDEVQATPLDAPVDAYADAGDVVMDKAAASVAVARQANREGNPATVDAELGVAANLLPRPSTVELAQAMMRAKVNDPDVYQKALEQADQLQRELDSLWNKVEAEKANARAALEAKQMELDAARAETRDLIWTGIGGLLVVLAGAGFVWGSAFGVSKVEALIVLGLGFACGSLPWVLDSDLSAWIVAPAGGLVALRLILWIWRKPNEETNKTKVPPNR